MVPPAAAQQQQQPPAPPCVWQLEVVYVVYDILYCSDTSTLHMPLQVGC